MNFDDIEYLQGGNNRQQQAYSTLTTNQIQQFAYRHLIIEYNLLNQYGEKFRQQIIELKRQGHKTEPAFGLALGLTGDPYMELLKFETTDKSPNR